MSRKRAHVLTRCTGIGRTLLRVGATTTALLGLAVGLLGEAGHAAPRVPASSAIAGPVVYGPFLPAAARRALDLVPAGRTIATTSEAGVPAAVGRARTARVPVQTSATSPTPTVVASQRPTRAGLLRRSGSGAPWLRRVLPPRPPAVDASTPPRTSQLSAPRGDLPGWRQVFVDDFATDAPLGTFLTNSAYKSKWTSYDGYGDTSGVGWYDPTRVLSAHDGVLDMFLHTENGRALGAAPIPLFDGRWSGQTYGRFSVRFRADPLPGYGAGWLLWPNSDNWDEGEIDFPEGDLDKHFWAHNHCVGDAARSCWSKDTKTSFTDWHTATIEWLPGSVTFFLDGALLGRSDQAPSTRMHLVLQTATTGVRPAASTKGHVEIDWVSIWAPA